MNLLFSNKIQAALGISSTFPLIWRRREDAGSSQLLTKSQYTDVGTPRFSHHQKALAVFSPIINNLKTVLLSTSIQPEQHSSCSGHCLFALTHWGFPSICTTFSKSWTEWTTLIPLCSVIEKNKNKNKKTGLSLVSKHKEKRSEKQRDWFYHLRDYGLNCSRSSSVASQYTILLLSLTQKSYH